MSNSLRVGDISARVVPHPEYPEGVLCCGREWNMLEFQWSEHLIGHHYTVTTYTDDEKRNALVPLFLEAPRD